MRTQSEVKTVKCPGCGGQSELDFGSASPVCEYCGRALLAEARESGVAPDSIAPLRLAEGPARRLIDHWIRAPHEDVPPAFSQSSRLVSVQAAYWPFYLMTGVYSGWRANGTISGGFNEFIPATGKLNEMRQTGRAVRFFTPPTTDVSLEELSDRIMNELFDERRGSVHIDFCRNVLRHATTSCLVPFSGESAGDTPQYPLTITAQAAELQLKNWLESRAKIKDLYFQQLNVKRVYWPFWTAVASVGGVRYFIFLDGSSSQSEYIGGYKPVLPEKAQLQLERFVDDDLDDVVKIWTVKEDVDATDSSTRRMIQLSKTLSDWSGPAKLELRTGCFIATAAYGSDWAAEVAALRRFRDQVLERSVAGRLFIRLYYRLAPAAAVRLARSSGARAIVRRLLTPLVRVAERWPQ